MRPIYLLLILLLASCAGRKPAAVPAGELYTPRYAQGFRIDSIAGGGLCLCVSDPWQGAEGVERSVVVPRPLSRIVAMSSTHVAMLAAIGAGDCLAAVSGARFLTNPEARKLPDIGYGGNTDYEKLLGLRPDMVLLYGVDGASPMEKKLAELHIPCIYIGDYLEQSPLGKAEWMVALGMLTGKGPEAKAAFAKIAGRYEALRKAVAARGKRPKVMLNTPAGGAWLMPPKDSYMTRLIADAGGFYLGQANTSGSSRPIDMEEARVLAAQADYWLNADGPTLGDLRKKLPQFQGTGCLDRGDIFANNRRATPAGGNDFYESAIVHPDDVLADLIAIFNGGEPQNYYRRLR